MLKLLVLTNTLCERIKCKYTRHNSISCWSEYEYYDHFYDNLVFTLIFSNMYSHSLFCPRRWQKLKNHMNFKRNIGDDDKFLRRNKVVAIFGCERMNGRFQLRIQGLKHTRHLGFFNDSIVRTLQIFIKTQLNRFMTVYSSFWYTRKWGGADIFYILLFHVFFFGKSTSFQF